MASGKNKNRVNSNIESRSKDSVATEITNVSNRSIEIFHDNNIESIVLRPHHTLEIRNVEPYRNSLFCLVGKGLLRLTTKIVEEEVVEED